MPCFHEIKSMTRTSLISIQTFGIETIVELEQSSEVEMSIKKCIRCGTQIFVAKPKTEKESYFI